MRATRGAPSSIAPMDARRLLPDPEGSPGGRAMHHHHHHHGRRVVIGGSTGALINIIVMFGVGLLLFVMGIVFVGIAMSVPILRMSFTGTGAVLACVGLGMFAGGGMMW